MAEEFQFPGVSEHASAAEPAQSSAAPDEHEGDDVWSPLPVGRPIPWFEPRAPFPTVSAIPAYRPDTSVDGWSTDHFTLRAATVRGYRHRFDRKHLPRQDDFALEYVHAHETLVIAVADGVSQAPYAHLGASVVCRHAIQWIHDRLALAGEMNWTELFTSTAWALVEFGHRSLGQDMDTEAIERALATTLTVAIVDVSNESLRVRASGVGDSCIWVMTAPNFSCLIGAKGDASIADSAVVALPRVPESIKGVEVSLPSGSVLLVGTDGIGDPLGSGAGLVGQMLAHHLVKPPRPLRFGHILDFSRETFDDDRTLVAVWPRDSSAEIDGNPIARE